MRKQKRSYAGLDQCLHMPSSNHLWFYKVFLFRICQSDGISSYRRIPVIPVDASKHMKIAWTYFSPISELMLYLSETFLFF